MYIVCYVKMYVILNDETFFFHSSKTFFYKLKCINIFNSAYTYYSNEFWLLISISGQLYFSGLSPI